MSIRDHGSGVLKDLVTERINSRFAPLRARHEDLAAHPDHVISALRDGISHAYEVAGATRGTARTAMGSTIESAWPPCSWAA